MNALASRLPGRLGEFCAPGRVVTVVRLQGVITPTAGPVPRSVINLSVVEPALRRAFSHDRLDAVALALNSPGGSATQSALVADRVRGLAREHQVPVLAFCEDVVASGGYWLACAADEIYAHPTSLVGSIGVVSGSFGLAGLLERLGVERRLYTAGENKARLDPFLPEKPDDVAWLTGMQAQLHRLFVDWVRSRRGSRLRSEEDLFTGEVWTGVQALELGLVDGLGTPRDVLARRFPSATPVPVEPRRPLLARLGVGAAAAAALELLEDRAAWSRFGL